MASSNKDALPGDLSKVFAIVQIPLVVLILFIHTYADKDKSNPAFLVDAFITSLARTAVPCYFFMSGFLLFRLHDPSSRSDYARLLRSRFFSLFIPYMIWLCVPYVITRMQGGSFWISPREITRFFYSADYDWYSQPSLLGYDFDVINPPGGNYVIWYVRDLMVFIILSPLIRLALKYTKKAAAPICATAIVLNIGLAGYPATALWSFLLGCSLGHGRTDFLPFCRRFAKMAAPLWAAFAAMYVWNRISLPTDAASDSRTGVFFLNLSILCGGVAIFGLASRLAAKDPRNFPRSAKFAGLLVALAPASFFVYVTHELNFVTRFRFFTDSLVADPYWRPLVSYFAFNIVRLPLLIAVYFLMARLLPRTTALLTGGRSARRMHVSAARPGPAYVPGGTASGARSGSARSGEAASSAPGRCGTRTQDEP